MLVLEARPQLGGRATAFRRPRTGELVDNGQHVLFGCYRETLAFLDRDRRGRTTSARQPSLEVPFIDAAGRRSELRCPPLPAPLHLLAAVLDWDAMPWRDRLSALRLAGAAAQGAARAARASGASASAPAADDGLATGCARTARRTKLRVVAVGAARGRRAEPAARRGRGGAVRPRARGDVRPRPSDAALVLPTRPLHMMYAEPARRFIERRGGEVRTGALARIIVERRARRRRRCAGRSASAAPNVICAVRGTGCGACLADSRRRRCTTRWPRPTRRRRCRSSR